MFLLVPHLVWQKKTTPSHWEGPDFIKSMFFKCCCQKVSNLKLELVSLQNGIHNWWILFGGPKMSQDMDIPDFLWIWMIWEPNYGINNWSIPGWHPSGQAPFWGSHCIKSTWTEIATSDIGCRKRMTTSQATYQPLITLLWLYCSLHSATLGDADITSLLKAPGVRLAVGFVPQLLEKYPTRCVKHGGKRVYFQIMLVYQNKSEGTNWVGANTSAWNILRNTSFASWSWKISPKGAKQTKKQKTFQVGFVWTFSVPPKYHMCSMVFCMVYHRFSTCSAANMPSKLGQSWANPTCRVTMAVKPGLGSSCDLRSWSDEIRLMYTLV